MLNIHWKGHTDNLKASPPVCSLSLRWYLQHQRKSSCPNRTLRLAFITDYSDLALTTWSQHYF